MNRVSVFMQIFGFFKGKNLLIIIDVYSKYPEVYHISDITCSSTIQCFRDYFARWGMPKVLVTDNGTQFSANEFVSFCENNNVKQLFSPPYHPMSNGAAENFVKTLKDKLYKMSDEINVISNEFLNKLINSFLIDYRTMIHETTGKSPNELQINRKVINRFDVINKVIKEQAKQKRNFGGHGIKKFKVGEVVYFRIYNSKYRKWSKGKIIGNHSDYIYLVYDLTNRVKVTRHLNQIKPTGQIDKVIENTDNVKLKDDNKKAENTNCNHKRKPNFIVSVSNNRNVPDNVPENILDVPDSIPNIDVSPVIRKSSRTIKKPQRLMC